MQTNNVRFHLYEKPRIVTFIESEHTLVDARGWEVGGLGREEEELVFNGERV